MQDIPVAKIIHAAGMGLSISDTCKLLSIPRTQIKSVQRKYGLKFVSGHIVNAERMRQSAERKRPKPQSAKTDPYWQRTEAQRKKAMKKLTSQAMSASEKREIIYGYCLYEFELLNHNQGHRPILPCRSSTIAQDNKNESRKRQQENKDANYDRLLERLKKIQPATSADLAEVTGYTSKSITSMLQRLYMSGKLEREMQTGNRDGKDYRRWSYWIPEHNQS